MTAKRKRHTKRSSKAKGRYGVSVSYEVRRGKHDALARHAIDHFLHEQIRLAVPRVGKNLPDTGALLGDSLVRDLQYDWSAVRDCFTKGEAGKIAKAVERAGADAKIHPCRTVRTA